MINTEVNDADGADGAEIRKRPLNPLDPLFTVTALEAGTSPLPNRAVYLAMHQDYTSDYVGTNFGDKIRRSTASTADLESDLGELIVRKLLKNGSLHAGPFEHPVIQLAFGHFPHSCMQQLRTHRTGITFDVQSFRYTGGQIVRAARGEVDIESVVYLRRPGFYTGRTGIYEYTEESREADLISARALLERYALRIEEGHSYEHGRSLLPFDVRQHWVMTANARTVMHLLDMRWPADAQHEIRQLSSLMFDIFKSWMPETATWYEANRKQKSKLSF